MSQESNDVFDSIEKHIQKFGWGIVSFEEDKPLYVTSVGLHKTLSFPEIVIFGLPVEISHRIINSIGLQLKNGRVIKKRTPYTDIIEDYKVMFLEIDRKKRRPYFDLVEDFYEDNKVPVVQMIWSDEANHLPWEEGFDTNLVPIQPVLNIDVMRLGIV